MVSFPPQDITKNAEFELFKKSKEGFVKKKQSFLRLYVNSEKKILNQQNWWSRVRIRICCRLNIIPYVIALIILQIKDKNTTTIRINSITYTVQLTTYAVGHPRLPIFFYLTNFFLVKDLRLKYFDINIYIHIYVCVIFGFWLGSGLLIPNLCFILILEAHGKNFFLKNYRIVWKLRI